MAKDLCCPLLVSGSPANFLQGDGGLGRLTTTPLPAPFLAASKRNNQLNLEVERGEAEVRVEQGKNTGQEKQNHTPLICHY